MVYGKISQVLTSKSIIFQVPLLHNMDEYIVQRQLREEEKRKSRVSIAVITFFLFLLFNLHFIFYIIAKRILLDYLFYDYSNKFGFPSIYIFVRDDIVICLLILSIICKYVNSLLYSYMWRMEVLTIFHTWLIILSNKLLPSVLVMVKLLFILFRGKLWQAVFSHVYCLTIKKEK